MKTEASKLRDRLQKRASKYGLTVDQVEDLLVDPYCGICGTSDAPTQGWHFDHNHDTNRFRGILCYHCNVGLGHFKDYPQLLRLAADYVERHA